VFLKQYPICRSGTIKNANNYLGFQHIKMDFVGQEEKEKALISQGF
jgi:hypothetical protein